MRRNLIFLLLLLSVCLWGTILNVPSSYHYVSLAILASTDGDTVLVQPGTYNGVINYAGKAITIASTYIFTGDETDIYHTTLSGNYSDASLISFITGEGEGSILEGFTITNGGSPPQGGAINCDGTSPILRNLRITGNQATSGGAIYAINSASPAIYNCELSSNSGGDYGGAIYLEASNLVVEDCEFIDNYCGGEDVNGRAGGIFASQSTLTCTNTNFINNSSQAHAGAIYFSYSSGDLDGCQFVGNSASGNVGAVYFYNSDHLNVLNCTFYGNSGTDAGALRFYHNVAIVDVPVIVNTICWNNEPSELTFSMDDMENEIIIAYCDIEGGEEGIVTNDNVVVNWLDGNIDDDPLFISPEDNFVALQSDSPCINAGTAFFEYETITYLDLTEDEYIGTAPEMGAVETNPEDLPIMATFECDILEGEAPLTVQFTDLSLGEIAQWEWDFDNDGEIDSEDQSPEWIYEEEGTYTVRLTVIRDTQVDDCFMVDLIEVLPPSAGDEYLINAVDLLKIYPNPFNPQTEISYNLSSNCDVILAVYNIRGQKVAELVSGHQTAGEHSVVWEADSCSAGMYFFSLQRDGYKTYEKGILLK